MNLTKQSVSILLLCLLALFGCAGLLEDEKNAPHIVTVVSSISIAQNQQLPITLEYLEVFDINGDPLTLIVHEGDNYTLQGNLLSPALDFIGELSVPLQLMDSTGLYSSIDTLTVLIVDELVLVQPLIDGALWDYADTVYTLDSVGSSTLICQSAAPLAGVENMAPLFSLQWESGDGKEISYLYENRPLGLYQVGAFSAVDTLVTEQYKLRYPAVIDESWDYAPVYAKEKSGFFFQAEPLTMSFVSDAAYITVPFGVFQCVQYEYTYQRGENSRGGIFGETLLPEFLFPPQSRRNSTVRVRLSYATGVGCVQVETFVDESLVIKKTLRSFKQLGEL